MPLDAWSGRDDVEKHGLGSGVQRALIPHLHQVGLIRMAVWSGRRRPAVVERRVQLGLPGLGHQAFALVRAVGTSDRPDCTPARWRTRCWRRASHGCRFAVFQDLVVGPRVAMGLPEPGSGRAPTWSARPGRDREMVEVACVCQRR